VFSDLRDRKEDRGPFSRTADPVSLGSLLLRDLGLAGCDGVYPLVVKDPVGTLAAVDYVLVTVSGEDFVVAAPAAALLLRGEGRSIFTTSPANTAFDSSRARWVPGNPAQEQAEAQSGSKATRPTTRRVIEARPVSSRV